MTITDRVETGILGVSVSVSTHAKSARDATVTVEYEIYLTDEALEEYGNPSYPLSATLSEVELLEFEKALIDLLQLESFLDSLETDSEVIERTYEKRSLNLGYKVVDNEWNYFLEIGFMIVGVLSGSHDMMWYPLLKDIGSIKQRTIKLSEEASRISSLMQK